MHGFEVEIRRPIWVSFSKKISYHNYKNKKRAVIKTALLLKMFLLIIEL